MSTLLMLSDDVVGKRMAGPGCRFYELARVLSRDLRVVLAAPGKSALKAEGIELFPYDPEEPSGLKERARESDVIFLQGLAMRKLPFLKDLSMPLIVDISCPFFLENLEVHLHNAQAMEARLKVQAFDLESIREPLRWGDFFLCASERQRHLWLGMLSAMGRINPLTYADDQKARHLIDVLPFGLRDEEPSHTQQVIKGRIKGIQKEDKVILWAGGIFNWLDPLTPIEAMALLTRERADVKLLFLGASHPNPELPSMAMVEKARSRARDLGLLERQVFFLPWVDYEERQNYLLEADVGISAHREHLESQYAFRTRLLDYIWASVPMVVSKGDQAAELVEEHDLGLTVEPEEPEAMAKAFFLLLNEPERWQRYRQSCKLLRPALTWEKVAQPLRRFCLEPHLAPDKGWASALLPPELMDKAQLIEKISALEHQLLLMERKIRLIKKVPFLETIYRFFKR